MGVDRTPWCCRIRPWISLFHSTLDIVDETHQDDFAERTVPFARTAETYERTTEEFTISDIERWL